MRISDWSSDVCSSDLMDVVFRIFDDGVGFRYVLPEQPNLQTAHIADELTEFAVAGDGTAWWIPGGKWNRYEYLYNKTPISSIAQAHTPLTVDRQSVVTGKRVYVSVAIGGRRNFKKKKK